MRNLIVGENIIQACVPELVEVPTSLELRIEKQEGRKTLHLDLTANCGEDLKETLESLFQKRSSKDDTCRCSDVVSVLDMDDNICCAV